MNATIVLISAVLCLCIGCSMNEGGDEAAKPDEPDSGVLMAELREKALGYTSADLKADPAGIWGVIIDVGLDDGGYTVIVFPEDASIYFEGGGGVIGGGQHERVRQAGQGLLQAAAQSAGHFRENEVHPIPSDQRVRIYLKTGHDKLLASEEIPEAEIQAENHPLHPIYTAMHGVIYEIRMITGG